MFEHPPHANAAIAIATKSPVCPTCGTIHKSGKTSCCGHGGSWFGQCGSADGRNREHAWHEGIWACKARQFLTAVDQRAHAPQTKGNCSSDDDSMGVDSKAIAVAAHLFDFKSTDSVTAIPIATQIAPTANASTLPRDIDSSSSKYFIGRTSTIKNTLASMPTSQTTIPSVGMAISLPVNGAITPQSTRNSGSAPTSGRSFEGKEVLRVIAYVGIIIIIIF